MASGARSTLVFLAGLGGFAMLCLTAIAFVGKQIDDAQVAIGHVSTPEETRRVAAERLRVFQAMTPAQHLARAREVLGVHFDLGRGNAGAIEEAQSHLEALVAPGPERDASGPLVAEIARRRLALRNLAGDVVLGMGRRLSPSTDEAELREQRGELASALDRLPALGCVHAMGPSGTVLRFDSCGCNEAFLASVKSERARAVLRRVGFRRVQCGSRAEGYFFVP